MPASLLRRARAPRLVLAGLGVALALGASACGSGPTTAAPAARATRHRSPTATAKDAHGTQAPRSSSTSSSTTVPPTTGVPPTTVVPPTTGVPQTTTDSASSAPPASVATGAGDHGPITSPPLPAPGPGFVEGKVTAIGDSVMLDYQTALEQDIPGVQVTAVVGRQWTQGEALLAQLKAQGQLGAVVIVGLGTNGPIDAAQFDQMASILSGASRIVFVNIRVDRTWQDPNNTVLANGVATTPNATLVHWHALADEHPTWLYPTQTHMPPGGTGAQALASIVASSA